MINTIWGKTDKPVAARMLSELLSEDPEINGTLYLGYPIIGTPEGSFPVDAILVSPQKGLVMFSLVEGVSSADYDLRQDDAFNKMSATLLQHSALILRRVLQVKIHTITFAPAIRDTISCEVAGYPLANSESLIGTITR